MISIWFASLHCRHVSSAYCTDMKMHCMCVCVCVSVWLSCGDSKEISLIVPARSGALHRAIQTLLPSLTLASKVAKMPAVRLWQHTFDVQCFYKANQSTVSASSVCPKCYKYALKLVTKPFSVDAEESWQMHTIVYLCLVTLKICFGILTKLKSLGGRGTFVSPEPLPYIHIQLENIFFSSWYWLYIVKCVLMWRHKQAYNVKSDLLKQLFVVK